MKILNLLLVSILLLFIACNNQNIPAATEIDAKESKATKIKEFDAQALATNLCECLEMGESQHPVKVKEATMNQEEIPNYFADCETEMTQQWGAYNNDKYQRLEVQKAMQAQCPEILATLKNEEKGNLSKTGKAALQSKKSLKGKGTKEIKFEHAKQ